MYELGPMPANRVSYLAGLIEACETSKAVVGFPD